MWRKLLCAVLLVLAGNAWGNDDVLVDQAWLRESVSGQGTASLQLNLTVTKPAMLLAVSSPLAATVEIQRVAPGPGKVRARAVQPAPAARPHGIVRRARSVAGAGWFEAAAERGRPCAAEPDRGVRGRA